jgi:hypothetical protein
MCLDVKVSYKDNGCAPAAASSRMLAHDRHTLVIMAAYNCHACPCMRAQESRRELYPR